MVAFFFRFVTFTSNLVYSVVWNQSRVLVVYPNNNFVNKWLSIFQKLDV